MTAIYIAGAWVEQHHRPRPMIAKLREAGVEITCDWTQAEGDVCACGHHRQKHAPFACDGLESGCSHGTRCWFGTEGGMAFNDLSAPPSECACRSFNGIGSGGDSLLTDADRRKYAQADLDGVLAADIVWLLAANDRGACGSWVELGAALARRELCRNAGVRPAAPHIVVSGPKCKRTIFTELADRWDEDDELALGYVIGLHRGSL
ncbi:MAG: hypothetical protein ACYDDA_05015 [Acidiferrobacteraceae bacterium]